VPPALVDRLLAADQRGGATEVRAEGIRAAIALCGELLDDNAPGLHFYTLNNSTTTSEIYHALYG
jgi:methylenetetrahydrofolate reductase (NADPH)